MRSYHSHDRSLPYARAAIPAALALIAAMAVIAAAQAPPVHSAPNSPAQGTSHKSQTGHSEKPEAKPISEGDLEHRFQGKALYLRGGYIDNDLRFDMHGALVSGSPQVSFTLGVVQVDKVHVSKHRVEIQGIRYGIHFLGAGPGDEDPTAYDKVRITPKKKVVKISIARAEVVHRKKKSKGETVQAESGSTSQEDANRILNEALDRVFSADLDERMIASLPSYWQLYYRAVAAKANYRPSDPSVLHQNAVDQKARLLTNFEPPSNDFAQKAGVVGIAQYHVVVGLDGKAGEIAIGRPIGFGLDENAIASIRKASFQPAMKDGRSVPVLLDLLVEFRIYSNRTGAAAGSEGGSATLSEPQGSSLPGPYSANQPANKQQ